jgi:hypothetical protein
MTAPDPTMTPVPIHLASTSVPIGPTEARKIYRATYFTLTLVTAGDAEPLLPVSGNREIAWVQPLDDNIVINGLQSDAARGNGLIIPKTNGQPYPIQDSGSLFVSVPVLAGATSRVTVCAVYCEPDTSKNMDSPGPG